MAKLRLASLNVRGLKDPTKRRQIFQYCKEKQFDVILLQETHLQKEDEYFVRSIWGGDIFHSYGENNARGVAIMIRKETKVNVKDVKTDKLGRVIVLDIDFEGDSYTIINIYAPNLDTPQFFAELSDYLIHDDEETAIILGGDFNLVLNASVDRITSRGKNPNKEKSLTVLNRLITEYKLMDIWRFQHKHTHQYTWKRTNPDLAMSRLDFFLVTENIKARICDSEILPSVRSDHDIPTIIIKKRKGYKGTGSLEIQHCTTCRRRLLSEHKGVD